MKSLQTFKICFDDMVSEFKEMQYLNEKLTRENKELKRKLELVTVIPEYIPQASFHDLTRLYPPGYNGFIGEDFEEYHSIVRKYIRDFSYEFNDGDILFLGSTYETRQEYGFYYVTNSCTDIVNGEYIYDCILQERHELYYNDVLLELSQFIKNALGNVGLAEDLLDESFKEELIKMGKIFL